MIQALYDKHRDDLSVLTINSNDAASIDKFMRDGGLTFPVLRDTSSNVMRSYKLQYYPTTFFIDRDGIIRDKVIGGFPNLDSIENRLKKIISNN